MQVRATSDPVDHGQTPSAATGRHRLPRRADSDVTVASESLFDAAPAAAFPAESNGVGDTPDDAVAPRWPRLFAYVLLPTLIALLGAGAGLLTWEVVSAHFVRLARAESVRAATDGAVALLTYRPDTVDKDLSAARERLTGAFKDSYTMFTRQEVIPDARAKHTSSVVTVPAAASVQATIDHAVVMLFVNQTFLNDSDPPTSSASDVRVTLEKVGRRWLISEFTPV